MKIHFLTRYGPLAPSSRLRSYQFAEPLGALGHTCVFHPLLPDTYVEALYSRRGKPYASVLAAYLRRAFELPSILADGDVVVAEKEIFPYLPAGVASLLVRGASTPILVDYDDAVYASYSTSVLAPAKIDAVMATASAVIAGNHTIESYARHLNPRVYYLPTVVDTRKYVPVDRYEARDRLVVGWIGTPVTEVLLHGLGPILRKVAERCPLTLYAVGASRDFRISGVETTVIPWTEATETAELRRMDLGIMPLEDNMWNRGKCGYKLVQYMAAGLPTIASPVGANKDIVVPGVTGFLASDASSWIEAFQQLTDPARRAALGRAGRKRVEEEFSLAAAAPAFAGILERTIERSRGRGGASLSASS